MKQLIILFFCLSSCLSFSQASWKQVGDLSTIFASTASPILKNLSDGRPVLICTNEQDELIIALFDIQSNSWDFNTYGFLSGIFNLSVDVFDQTIIIGCKSTNADYGVYLYDVPTNNLTDLTPFGGTYNNTVEGTIKVTCGGLNPLKVALAYEFSDGAIGSVEYNSGNGDWEPLAENSSSIFPNNTAVIYGSSYGIKTVSNTNTIYIVSNFNGGAGNSLRVFSKPWGSTASYIEALDVLENPTAIEINGAPFFDVSSNKGANAAVIHNFVKNGNELIGRIQSNPNSVMQTPYGPYTHASNLFEIANTGNNSTNYVFHSDDYNPTVGSFVRSWDGSSWNQIGGPVVTGTIYELDMMMHPLTKKPFVSFGDGNGNYTVKAFNTAPVFLQEGTPAVFCSNNVSNMLLDSLIFSDADGDSLVFNGISSTNTNVINPDSVTITSIGYNPVTGINGFEITGQPGNIGTTTLTISVTDGIETVSHSFDVTIYEVPTISAGSDLSICSGSGVTLSGSGTGGSGTYSYTWDNGVSNGVGFFPVSSTTYTVIGTDGNGCSNSDMVFVDVLVLPTTNGGPDYNVCEFTPITLTASGDAVTYNWDNGVVDGQTFTPSVGTTNYILTGTGSNGCVSTDVVNVTVYPAPAVDGGPDVTICAGQGITLTATANGGTGNLDISWDNCLNGVEFFPMVNGVYTAFVTDDQGCNGEDPVLVTVLSLPTIDAGNDITICEGDSIALIATGAGSGTYSWDSPVIQGEQVLVENSGYYSVIGTDNNGCSNIDSLLVTLNPNPALNVPADISICEGDGLTLTATGAGAGATYDWSNNVINGQEFFPPTGLYEISVIGTDVNGCQGYDTVGLNVYINWFTSEDMTICNGDTLNWNGQLLDSTGSYTQILTSIYGCDSTVTLNLNVIEPNISLPFSEVCQNQNPITLMNFVTPIGGNFSGTGIFNNKFYPNQVAPNNVYTITYTRYFSAFGCSASNTFDLTVNPTPSINMNIQNATCGQEDGSATASFSSPGSNGLHDAYWSVGFMDSATASSTISNLSSGLYFVNVNNEYGCTATAPATISSNSISISGTSSPVSCFGGNDGSIDISITNSAGIASINWSNGATSEDLVNLMVGPYEVTVIDNNGCESIASFNVGGPDEMTWTTSTMNSSCGNADGSASVIAQGGTGSYDWEWYDSQNNLLNSSTGMQSNLLAGEYTCIMTDQSGCITTVSIVVSDEGSPEIELIDVVNASCDNDGAIDIDIISNNGVQSISWSNGDSTEDIAGLASDEYSVYVMDTLGCAGMLWVNVEPVLPETQPICLITVDTITTTNKLVWERAQLTGIASYNIYRETSEANVYQLVHSQLFDEESEWTDTVASPMVRSWRYKMTAVDSCGYESDFSPVHKTIHLTISAGIGDDVNLNWDSYEGFEYTQLKLWRVTDATGWIELTTIPANLFSYTDLSIINEPGLDYLIEIEPADLCTSEKAQDYNSSRSNKARGEFNPNGDGNVGVEQYALELIEIYPNPTSDELNILLNSSVSHGVIGAIMDAQGKRIRQFVLKNGLTTVNVNNLEKGMYFIQIPGKTENNILKFVKN